MNRAAVSEDTIVQEVSIKAPAERIFEALINPAEILRWWAADGKFKATLAEFDPRVGGRWRMRVDGCGGAETGWTLVSGEYRVVDPPRALEMTWIRETEKDHPDTVVRWDLEEAGEETRVRVTHSGLMTDAWKARNNGWWIIVDRLKMFAESGTI